MNKITILRVLDKKVRTPSIITHADYGMYEALYVRNRKRAIRKIIRKNKGEIIAINHKCKDEYIFENYINSYKELSIEVVLPVIEKICRAAARKFNLKLPLEDIYLYASPSLAYKFVENLIGVSRIFTIVSKEPSGEEAEKLYFEKGCLIRHVQKVENKVNSDTLSIFIERGGVSFSPVINITTDAVLGEKVIDVRKVAVTDNKIKEIEKSLGGTSGLVLYTLIGKIPGGNAEVNINKAADTIFLLDTNAI